MVFELVGQRSPVHRSRSVVSYQRGIVLKASFSVPVRIWLLMAIADVLVLLRSGRPNAMMSVFVSFRLTEANVPASGAVTLTSFQVGVTLPLDVM
jgi:hypothetical protein